MFQPLALGEGETVCVLVGAMQSLESRTRTNASGTPLVSSATRFVA